MGWQSFLRPTSTHSRGWFRGRRTTLLIAYFMSLTIQQAKKLIDNQNLSDTQIEQIISASRMIAEIVFEKWVQERKLTINKVDYGK